MEQKPGQEGPRIDPKGPQNGVRYKLNRNSDPEAEKKATATFFGKLWGPILVENGSQDGGLFPFKMDQKAIQNLCISLLGFECVLGGMLVPKWRKNRCKNDVKKHIAIELEVEVAKTQKMTPLTAFLYFFK